MKTIIIRLILITLIFLNFAITFGFSGQTGTESSGISRKVTLLILNVFGDYDKPLTEEKELFVKNAEHIVRKLAHFSIYTILGMLLMGLASTFNISTAKRILTSLVGGLEYASLDEFHQSFIPGRTAMITDVLIDTAGIIMGILIIFGITKIYNNYERNKRTNESKKI